MASFSTTVRQTTEMFQRKKQCSHGALKLLKKYWISKLVFKTLKKYWIWPKCTLSI